MEKAERVLADTAWAQERVENVSTAVALIEQRLIDAGVAGEQTAKANRVLVAMRRAREQMQEANRVITETRKVHRVLAERRRPCETRSRQRVGGRAPRLRTNHRTRGSARSTRAGPSSSDDPPDESDSEPPRLRLWRHPRFGSCSPNLLRVIVEAGR